MKTFMFTVNSDGSSHAYPMATNVPPKKKAAPAAQSKASGCTCGNCGKPPAPKPAPYTPPTLAALWARMDAANAKADAAHTRGDTRSADEWRAIARADLRDIRAREKQERSAGAVAVRNMDIRPILGR